LTKNNDSEEKSERERGGKEREREGGREMEWDSVSQPFLTCGTLYYKKKFGGTPK